MQALRWMRVPGDVLFAAGAALFAWFILGLLTGHSYDDTKSASENTPNTPASNQ
jgi:nitric oxide reductase subunit B